MSNSMIVFISVGGFLLLFLLDADAKHHQFGRSRAMIRTGRGQNSKLSHSIALTFRGRPLSSYPSSQIIDDNEHKVWIKRKIFRLTRLLKQGRRRI